MDRKARLKAMYETFNARDIDAVLHQLTADVDWPNAWEAVACAAGRIAGPFSALSAESVGTTTGRPKAARVSKKPAASYSPRPLRAKYHRR